MSYIDQNLLKNEQVLYRAKISWWAGLPTLILALFLILTLYFAIVGFILIIAMAIRISTTELAVTNKRVLAKFGWIRRQTVELKLDRIEGIRVSQGIFGRMFNYGSLIVSGVGVMQAPIPAIDNPMMFKKRCLEQSEAMSEVSSAASPPSVG